MSRLFLFLTPLVFVLVLLEIWMGRVNLTTLSTLTAEVNAPQPCDFTASNNSTKAKSVDYQDNKYNWTQSWCPRAQCHGIDLCHPCQRRWLLILAPGRTASTTLTEMLARLPGVRMAGENKNGMGQFLKLQESFQWAGPGVAEGAFRHYKVWPETWSCLAQRFFESINPPPRRTDGTLYEKDDETTIVGFKTIVYQNASVIRQMFPCSRVIVNIRSDIKSFQKSRKKHFWQEYTEEFLHEYTDQYRALYRDLGSDQAFLLDSSNWTTNVAPLNDLLSWLGFNEHCNFTKVLQYNTRGYRHGDTKLQMDPACRLIG